MLRYAIVVIGILLVARNIVKGFPVTIAIDCPDHTSTRQRGKLPGQQSFDLDVRPICDFIHRSIPKAVLDGRFIDDDQQGFSNNQIGYAVAPPKAVIPKWGLHKSKASKLPVPKVKVPKLRSFEGLGAPRVASTSIMTIPSFKKTIAQESSAERMEKFKKGVQKMLHVVKVLGQIDQYLSERTRIIVDKLSKTFAD